MANPEPPEWEQACQETVATLRSALRCHLPPAHWEQVREILAEMAAAAAAADLAALLDAGETLDLLASVRVMTALGDQSPEPAPGRVREQVAELVDSLEPHGARERGGTGLPEPPGQAARHGA